MAHLCADVALVAIMLAPYCGKLLSRAWGGGASPKSVVGKLA